MDKFRLFDKAGVRPFIRMNSHSGKFMIHAYRRKRPDECKGDETDFEMVCESTPHSFINRDKAEEKALEFAKNVGVDNEIFTEEEGDRILNSDLKLLLTDVTLDKLGFTSYNDGSGDWGTRDLWFSNGIRITLREWDEREDDTDGYGNGGKYISANYEFWGSDTPYEINDRREIHFLHDLYDCIEEHFTSCLNEFFEKCEALNMRAYLVDHFKERIRNEENNS